MNDDKVVKVKKSDLQALIDANTKAYNLLDEIDFDTLDKVKSAYHALEDVPGDPESMIIEEEDEDNDDDYEDDEEDDEDTEEKTTDK